jgi:BNR repeat-like domain
MLSLALLFALHLAPSAPGEAWKQPQLANSGDQVGLTFGAGNSIYYASSDDFGKSFSKPVLVSSEGKLMLGRHRGPRVAFQSGNVVISAVVDGNLQAWHSDDAGLTWSKPVVVNDIPQSAAEGLQGMTSGNGWVILAWLDTRGKGTAIYGAISKDGGETWSENNLIYASPDGTVCQCCHPSVAIGPGGTIYVMFRNVLDGSRDLYLATARGSNPFEFQKLGDGTWKLDACPMDGGDIDVGSRSDLISVWRREDTIYADNPGEKEIALGTGTDPAVAAGMNDLLWAAWVHDAAIVARNNQSKEAVTLSPKGAFPTLLMTGNGTVIGAWEQDQGISVAQLPDAAPPAQ